MDQTRNKPPHRQSTYENFFSDEVGANRQQQGAAQDFQSQLETIISSNQADALEQLVQQHPQAWSLVSPDELGKWLLAAVKKGHLAIVDALVRKSVPGKAAAIPLDMQLALVEAARFERNSEPEMALLLDALLQAVDCPVQHLGLLVNRAMQGQYFAISTFLLKYKENFEKARNRQPLHSIYDAAADGDAVRLQKELEAELGIPPLDDKLTGGAWFINMLVHWVAALFTTGAAQTLVNKEMGNLPLLHAAVKSGDEKTVLFLIEKGADLSAVDKDGHNALSRAKEQGKVEIIALLQKLGAPDRASFPDGALAPTQAANGSRIIAGQAPPRHKDRMDRPSYNDTVASFKTLLPDVASILSGSEDLATELNGAEAMSVAQAGLFTASYLAEFEPPQAVDGQKTRGTLLPRTANVVLQLQDNKETFRAEGLRLEASKAEDIHRVLDTLTSTSFADLLAAPRDIEQRLRAAGLCNLLIGCVVQAVNLSRGNPDWLSATDERRKEIFIPCLRKRLRSPIKKRSAVKEEGSNQALYEQLLRRQIALLENYCKAVDDAPTAHAGKVTDFSKHIW
jgi:ankyrin repeat protein